MSRSMICCVRALWTSTMGVSPVTVIVSSTAPTLRSAFTVATKLPDSSMPFAFHGTEPGQRERHGIGAGPEIDDAVLAGGVGDDRPDLFNQDGAGGFHRHARQDAARGVPDDAGDRGLCIGRRRYEQRNQHDQQGPRGSLDQVQHRCPPQCLPSRRRQRRMGCAG